MEFTILDPASKEFIILPIAPETLKVQIDAKIQTFEPVTLGNVEVPRGRMPLKFYMSGLLPGLNQNVPYRASDLSPEEIVQKFIEWGKEKGANGKKLRFIVTETNWNLPVFYPSFVPEYSGGLGDIRYTLELTEYRDFVVKEVKPQTSGVKGVRSTNTMSKTYTIKKGDTLWAIARKYTGSGAKWTELWAANKGKLKSGNPDLIYPSEVIVIPQSWLK